MHEEVHTKLARYRSRFCAVVLGIGAVVIPSELGYQANLPDVGNDCLASAIYHEARGEHVKAQRAVAEVVLNRAYKSGKSVCEIVAAKRQFSWYTKHKIKVMDQALADMLDEAFKHPRILKNENFLYFYSGQAPYWARHMTCRPLGRLNFCKEQRS